MSKGDSCPTCGQPNKGGVRKDNPVQKPQKPLGTANPAAWPGGPKHLYREAMRRGEHHRGEHFNAGIFGAKPPPPPEK